MSEKVNYQLVLEETIKEKCAGDKKPTLLLHACCAPCSSYVLEYLSGLFDITALYYNPNITPESEYDKRSRELARLVSEMPEARNVKLITAEYDPAPFLEIAKGREKLPEGGERCFDCYRLRLEYSASYAKENSFDYFCTTLSISPLKNAGKLNSIGAELAEKYGIPYLFSDFKKKNGYKRSCELSAVYSLYRQDYCGCVFSRAEAEKRREPGFGVL